MAFASLDADENNAPLAEINMVPLIDVMLVLLIIFMVTAPLLTHAVKIDLPKASSAPNQNKSAAIQLGIDADRKLIWNGELIDAATLPKRLESSAKQQPQPELHLRAERTTPYEIIAQIMSEAARAGLTRIGFVTAPPRSP